MMSWQEIRQFFIGVVLMVRPLGSRKVVVQLELGEAGPWFVRPFIFSS
jgi:hypothetical protein